MTPIEIKELRLSKGLTQVEFGELVGVRVACVSDWERGKNHPSRLAMARIQELMKEANKPE